MIQGRASVSVPVRLLARHLREAQVVVWDVAVEGPLGRAPCGRTAGDVSDPRRVYRYAAQAHPRDEGPSVLARPYFTNDLTLAVEIDGTARVPVGT